MPGSEKPGKRRGRGRSKKPRSSQGPYGEIAAPHEPPQPPQSPALSFATNVGASSHSPVYGVHSNASEPIPIPHIMGAPARVGGEVPMSSSFHQSSIHKPGVKVPIPPMRSSYASQSSKQLRGRTSHACESCQKAKAACSGGNPCTRCGKNSIPCVYGDGKREQERKKMSKLSKAAVSLSQHKDDVITALRRITLDESLSPDDIRSALDDILAMSPAPVKTSSDEENPALIHRRTPQLWPSMPRNEIEHSDEAAEVGSIGSLDAIDVDTDQPEKKATGHMGKSSAVTWSKRAVQETHDRGESMASLREDGFAATTYHIEEQDVEHFEPANVDIYEWPDQKKLDQYLASYFEDVHHIFPIIDKSQFMSEYRNFSRGSRDLSKDEKLWLGQINIIFAISSQHAQLSETQSIDLYEEHYTYCARAKGLLFDEIYLYQDIRIKSLRALGLLALYYMVAGRLNRAWTLCGLAIRHALTLGLHARNEAEELLDVDKEHRVRIWWCLYSLEVTLDELTGRPTCVADQDISTPLPMNTDLDDMLRNQPLYNDKDSKLERGLSAGKFHRDQPIGQCSNSNSVVRPLIYTYPIMRLPITRATYFAYQTQLAIVSHEIVTQLYCAATVKVVWPEVQSTVSRIDQRLSDWCKSLPNELDINFEDGHNWDHQKDKYTVSRIGLAVHYHSSRMILYRPFLCRFSNNSRMSVQSAESQDFNQKAVEICINSARNVISMLKGPASRSLKDLYSIAPWWKILHFLCEALSVLTLEMAYEAQHKQGESTLILDDAKLGVSWLAKMAGRSIAARKAWEIYDILVKNIALILRWPVFDMPNEAPCPPKNGKALKRLNKLQVRRWNHSHSLSILNRMHRNTARIRC
ncbi:fungal-specific transcription factor domain-containing protein [Calycina marina]|uniref:Fungal-specific transcription factor domain-containing protein n=1 Tax=Calycina marina TaxID=1763456 RepID=A0A9P7YZ62_9HELO|nr:fungal-specific transcription factor domain-containing protein [Calycina marina]